MAAKYKLSEILSPAFDMPTSYEDLEKVYRTVAKTADQRLVRLEQATKEENFRVADKWAYARAQRDIEQWSGPDATRFNTKPPSSISQLKAKIEDIKTFIEAPTSTKSGIKEVYKKKADTLNKKYGTKFKWNEVGTFFESDLSKKMDKIMSSASKVKVIANLQRNKKKIVESIKEANARDIKVPDDMVGELTKDTLKEYGDEVVDFLMSSAKK